MGIKRDRIKGTESVECATEELVRTPQSRQVMENKETEELSQIRLTEGSEGSWTRRGPSVDKPTNEIPNKVSSSAPGSVPALVS